jgi:hypothetical protein
MPIAKLKYLVTNGDQKLRTLLRVLVNMTLH